MSLYLKYRPQDFKSVVGQEHAKKTLQAALLANSLSHAYLFCGPRGTGKTSLARILAKRLNCLVPENNEPCNQCEICLAIQQGRLVDLIEIDAASNRGIDEIRELREKIVFSPTQAKSKVYIIDEVHMLTKEAFNALLKTLEEPPSHAYFILATTEAHKIPETIISRCQQFNFTRISLSDIANRLEEITTSEAGEAEKEALELIAKLSNGGLRDAIGLLEQMLLAGKVTVEGVNQNLGLTGLTHLEAFFEALIQKDPQHAIKILNSLKNEGKSVSQFVKEIIMFMRTQMHLHLKDTTKTVLILELLEAFLKAKEQLDISPIPELPLEMAIIKVCGFKQGLQAAPEPKMNEIEIKTPIQKIEIETIEESSIKPKSNLDFDYIKKEWPRVLENIATPFIKMSLGDAELGEYEGAILTLRFKSSSFMEKIESTTNQKEIQDAFQKVYGQLISLKLEAKRIQLSELQKKEENSAPSSDSVGLATEVFGIK